MEKANFVIAIISTVTAIFSAIAAWNSWRCAKQQKETEKFKIRCNHIQSLKKYWQNFNKDIVNVGYKIYVEAKNSNQDEIISGMNFIINELKLLNIETKSLFKKDTDKTESEFINSLHLLVPQQEWSIYHIEDNYQTTQKLYESLIQSLEEQLNKDAKI